MDGTWISGIFRFWKNVRVPFFKFPQKVGFWKCPPLSGSKFPLFSIHKIISRIWEDGSRKVNNDEPDLRIFHGTFWPVISHAVRKLCPRGGVQVSPFPLSSRRLDAKRHYVIWAKALDGIWPASHACAVLCWGTRRHASAQHCTSITNLPNTIQCLD